MGPSLQIMRVLDIPIKLHWTFVLVLPLGLYLLDKPGMSLKGLLFFGVLFLLISICVILHEYGHALAARHYGIKTDDIILSPLFGVARIQRLPDTPWGEFWVAVAGPLVNILLGLPMLAYLLLASPEALEFFFSELRHAFLYGSGTGEGMGGLSIINICVAILMFVNLGLVLFNLVPAFPMDGGRIFRALLHQLTDDKIRATWIATKVGQGLAVMLVAVSLYFGQYGMAAIGLFIYYMAMKEYAVVENEVFHARFHVGEVVRERFTRLDHFSVRSEVAHLFLRGLEKDFLVFDQEGGIAGILPKKHIIQWMREDESADFSNNITRHLITEFPTLHPDDKVAAAIRVMSECDMDFLPVLEDGELLGVVDRQGIYEYLETFRKLEGKR